MPPLSRVFRLVLRGFLALLLLALPAFAGLYLYLKAHVTDITRELMDYFSQTSGMVMTVESVGVDVLPLPSLTLVKSRVEGHGLSLEMAYARLTPSIAALLRGEAISGTVHFVRPRVSYVPDGKNREAPEGQGTPASVFNETMLRHFWPEYSRLKIEDGQADIQLDDNTHILLSGLHCDLVGSNSLAVRGRLALGQLFVTSPVAPDTTFSGIRLEGENSLFSLHPGEPHIRLAFDVQSGSWLARSHVDLGLRGHWQQWTLDSYLSGNFLKDGAALPFVFRGQFAHNGARQPRDVAVNNVQFSLGRDSVAYNGTLRLPTAASRLLEEAAIGGTLEVRRVSLTEWLGFARLLPAGLQHTLDTVNDGLLQFHMDGKGLRVPQIVATCQGSTFTGKGGVEDWRNPVVFLDLVAPQVNLGAAIPEAVAILPEDPDYGHGPLTPEGTSPTPEELAAKARGTPDEEILVGYDINLGADILNYGPLVINDARVRIHPGPYDKDNNSNCLLDATAKLYKGTVKGQLVLGWQDWLPYTITVSTSGVDGKGIATDLPVLPFTGGVWQGEGKVTSKGKQLDVFLENLRGNVTVTGRRGGLPVPLSGHDATSLSLALSGAVWKDRHLGLNGQWQGSLTGKDMQVAGATTGQIWFGERTRNRDVVDFDHLRGWLRMQTQAGVLGLAKPVDARLEGSFDWSPRQFVIRDAHLQALGATARGQWRIAEERGTFTLEGPVELDVPHLSSTVSAWGQQFKVPAFLPSLKGKAEVRATRDSFVLSKLQLRTGHTTITGALSGPHSGLLGKKPFSADLSLDLVDIDRYFPVAVRPRSETKKETDGGGHTLTAGSDASPAREKAPYKHASTPGASLDFSAIKSLAVQGTLHVGSLLCRKTRLQKLRIPFVLQNGKLQVTKLEGLAYGGPIKGSGHVLFGKALGLKGDVQATNVNLGPAMRERNMHMRGTAEVYANLAATLATTADWPRALNGTWHFALHNGQFQETDRNGRPKGKPTDFSLAQASGNITSGVLRSRDILLRGPDMVLKGNGKLDMPQDFIDCEFDVNMHGMPDFPMRLYGNLDNPRTSIGAGTLILNALGGLGSGLLDTVGGLFTGIGRIFTPQGKQGNK